MRETRFWISWLLGLGLGACAIQAHAAACDLPPRVNVGCVFYAVTLPNPLLDQSTFAFAVELRNLGAAASDVTISGGGLPSPVSQTIPAGSLRTTNLPWVPALSMSTATVRVVGAAYRIAASAPLVVVQLNPGAAKVGATYSYSGDGSLLAPEQAAGTVFRALVWPTENLGGTQYPGQLAIVATQDATTVQIAAAGGIQPGAGLTASGGTVLLDLGGVLLVSSAADAPLSGTGSDLSGALVTSDRPVLAFAGHAAAFVPVTAGFADHLEESLPPVSAWGSEYFIARPVSPVGFGAKHYVKVLADAPTTLSTNPVVAGLTSVLAAGQSSVVEATVDFQLLASAPVAVAAFMEGSSRFSDQHGDPSQLIVVPSREAQRELDFIAPLRLAPITAQLIAPTGAAVTIDDAAVTGWSAIGTSGQSLAHHSLCCSDLHHASGTAPFTLSVIAYPPYTSYWYPGGFELADGLFGDGFESP